MVGSPVEFILQFACKDQVLVVFQGYHRSPGFREPELPVNGFGDYGQPPLVYQSSTFNADHKIHGVRDTIHGRRGNRYVPGPHPVDGIIP